MLDETPDEGRSALRFLYGGAAALLRGDNDSAALTARVALPLVQLGDLLTAGALSIAEQLRDICEQSRSEPGPLLGLLSGAGQDAARDALMHGAEAYLTGHGDLWDVDDLCALAACPTRTVDAVIAALAETLTLRARAFGGDAVMIAERICLGLASRDAATV